MSHDIALTQEDTGEITMHRADCRRARALAALGKPVATLLGCTTLPLDLTRCRCMTEPDYPPDHPVEGDLGSIPL
jgi:hypothetical protein